MKHSSAMRRTLALWSLATVAAVGGTACDRNVYVVVDLATGGTDMAAKSVDLAGGDLSGPDLGCTPEVQSCSGLCGPVRDDCTGMNYQCGACASGTVCDLDSHLCITPKDDCAALGRVCGTTKNSCGQTISCTPFTCGDDAKECDPDTNQCVACTQVTCDDLGYQCGTAWLGCGDPTNTTDCGTCASGMNCNDALHVCEPANGGTCGTMTAQQMCDAAATANGVQCGVITNGCGGLIDCSTVPTAATSKYVCAQGTTCGGAGVPNQCAPSEPPLECFVAGYNCGTLPSACGGTVNCGTCDASQNLTCNLASGSTAGTCGTACNMPMKSCNNEYANKCGKNLDNNCWPALNCECMGNDVCSTSQSGVTGTCGNVAMCAQFQNGMNPVPCSTQASSSFPKGDGTFLTCQCPNTGTGQGQEACQNIDGTTHAGTCCVRKTCGAGDVVISDGCGGMINCCSANGQQVNKAGNACCTPGDPCSTTYANKYETGVTDACGNLVNGNGVCDCSRYGEVNPTTNGGACCAQPTCSDGMGGTYCDGRKVAASCNASVTVTCNTGACNNGSAVCAGNGECCVPATCPNDGLYHAAFNPGCGQPTIVCGCGNKLVPKNSSGNPVDGAHCCSAASCGSSCSGNTVYAQCNSGDTTVSPSQTQTKTCGTTCGGGQCCKSGTCQNKGSCSGICGTGLADGCGGNTLNCSCTSPATCSSTTSGTSGTCDCPAVTCNGCNPSTQTNGCGASNTHCGCTSPQVCEGSGGGACCTPKTCADLPQGAQCGTVADTCTNSNISCGCPHLDTAPSTQCVSGQCTCTPIHCCKDTGGVEPCIQPGSYGPSLMYPDHNDGCGNSGTCSS